ncbi:MAG: murein biosynthesis integral membrane protein MurJ [Anaerolineaceae bacterium]|nr:murein biosynthesis integral membrane protein MurJ [Anaerolineaceae bacterium]
MKKITKLSRAAILIAVSFGINKLVAIFRQLIIARQFGLSSDLDVFNVANNIPDMLYSLISGGALAVAIIPVMTELMNKKNRTTAWHVFSQVANIAFLVTALISGLVAIFAWPLVQHPLGIAPGFNFAQQALVVRLMRLDLIGTLIFSMAGLLIAGLQANQHFLLPAIGPVLYNIGQIFGAVILSPENGYKIGSITLPTSQLGVDGLVFGTLIGSFLYFIIQIPGLVKYQFKWTPAVNINNPGVHKILVMLGPRVLSMLLYQLTFIARDNLASHLPQGSVTALTYGWMILQVPETLIGTAIGTALLPTLSEYFAKKDINKFKETIQNVGRVLIALAIPATILLSTALKPFLSFAFGFNTESTELLTHVTRAFLAGLLGHVFLELGARIFFAQQNAKVPLIGAGINLLLYVIFGITLGNSFGAVGVGLADAIAFSGQALFLMILYNAYFHKMVKPNTQDTLPLVSSQIKKQFLKLLLRVIIGSLAGAVVILTLTSQTQINLNNLMLGLIAAILGLLTTIPFILPELRILFQL